MALQTDTQDDEASNLLDASLNDSQPACSLQPAKMDLLSDIDDFVETSVVLRKDKKNQLGISIVGGNNTYLDWVCVAAVDPEGVAAKDRRLKRGDILLEVNEDSLRDVSHQEALRLLKDASSPVQLLVLRENPQIMFTTSEEPRKFITVELRKTNITDRLGLSIMERENSEGVFVSWVEPGSIASRHGRILQGDRLLEINGVNVTDKNLNEMTSTLQNMDGAIVLLLGRVPALASAVQEWARNKGSMSPSRPRTSTWSYTAREKTPVQRPSLPDTSGESNGAEDKTGARKSGEDSFRVRSSTQTWRAPTKNLFRHLRRSVKKDRSSGSSPVAKIVEENASPESVKIDVPTVRVQSL